MLEGEAGYIILIQKYSLELIENVKHYLVRVPDVLPHSLRESLAAKFSDIKPEIFHLVCNDFKELCPTLYNKLPSVSEEDMFVLAPPVGNCVNCLSNKGKGYALKQNNKMVKIKYISTKGVLMKQKLCLRCTKCGLNYNYSKYGNGDQGYRFYDEQRSAVEANDCTFVNRTIYQFQWSLRYVIFLLYFQGLNMAVLQPKMDTK